MKLYISDLHLGHRNILVHDHRPFKDVDEMDRYLIERWNDRVSKDDDVYIVGDFCFRSDKPYEHYLRKLKGKKHLIIGNHDDKLLKDEKAMSYFESADYIKEVNDTLKGEKIKIVLCHYPLAEWNGMYHGTYHIYGHVHNRVNEITEFMAAKEKAYNAGCMLNGYAPCSISELDSHAGEYKHN